MPRYRLFCIYKPPRSHETPWTENWTIEAATDWDAVRLARARSGHMQDPLFLSAVILNDQGRVIWTDAAGQARPLHTLGLDAPPSRDATED